MTPWIHQGTKRVQIGHQLHMTPGKQEGTEEKGRRKGGELGLVHKVKTGGKKKIKKM